MHIGQYEIRGELGKGGFGRVYLAFDPRMGRQVAIKVLEAPDDDNLATRFHNEAMAAGNLRHRNIVTVYEFGESEGKQFLVMEYLEGHELQQIIAKRKPLAVLEKMAIMSQIAEGLNCAHQHGVIHRDIKPGNVMVLMDGSVKILDFGVARVLRESAARLTRGGYVMGTVAYTSPEQLRGAEVTAVCDIWAYGVIYYELLTGQHPFQAPDSAATMFRITSHEPEPARVLCPECPEALERILQRLLSKDPEQRYQTLEDVQFDAAPVLRQLQGQQAGLLLTAARQLIEEEKLEEAHAKLREILDIDPGNADARHLREHVQREIRQQSEQVSRLIGSVEKQLAAGNLPLARQALSEARQTESRNITARKRLTDLQRELTVREQRLRSGLRRAEELVAIGAFDDAGQILGELSKENTGTPELERLSADLQRQRAEYGAQLEQTLRTPVPTTNPGHNSVSALAPASGPLAKRNMRAWALAGGGFVVLAALAGLFWKMSSRPPATLAVTPAELAFTHTKGEAAPGAIPVSISTSAAKQRWNVRVNDPWISALPPGGTAPSRLRVSVDPSHLDAGSYAGELVVLPEDGGVAQRLRVKLSIKPPAAADPAAPLKPETAGVTDPVVDCHAAGYSGAQGGVLLWLGDVPPQGVVVLGRDNRVISGPPAQLKGKGLPGCDVSVRSTASGMAIEEIPSAANHYSRIRLRNVTAAPVSQFGIRWDVK
ncbi:MAG: protein kinase domain-containing protein [Bryobacteraceae bacterium]